MATLDLLDELITLEEKNLAGGLDGDERRRWVEISAKVFGTPADVAERRRFFRVSVVQHAEVRSPALDADATILSMSGGGIFISTSCVPAVGSQMQLEVTLPIKRELTVPFEGTVRWVADAPSPRGAAGKTGIGLSFDALTEDQRAALLGTIREQLLRSRTRALDGYSAYFAALPEAVFVIDRHNSIVACSDRARCLSPAGRGEVIGKDVGEVVTDDSRPVLAEAVGRARADARILRCSIWLGADDEQAPTPVDVVVAPLSGKEHEGHLVVSCRASEAFDDLR